GQCWCICAWENPSLRPGIERTRSIAADEMQKAAAAVAAHDAAEHLRKRFVMVQADVLQHADGDKHVVLAPHVAIVVVNELDAIGYPFASGAVLRVGQLLARYIECLHVDAERVRHMQRERSPPTSRFDNGLPRLQAELPADEIELRMLRVLERHLGTFEVG